MVIFDFIYEYPLLAYILYIVSIHSTFRNMHGDYLIMYLMDPIL